jgi:hypothetical protein
MPQSLPLQFVNYTADGKPVESGEPVRSQTISNVGQTASVSEDKK